MSRTPAPTDGRAPRLLSRVAWLTGTALASVVVGFVLGLARPRMREQVGEGW